MWFAVIFAISGVWRRVVEFFTGKRTPKEDDCNFTVEWRPLNPVRVPNDVDVMSLVSESDYKDDLIDSLIMKRG